MTRLLTAAAATLLFFPQIAQRSNAASQPSQDDKSVRLTQPERRLVHAVNAYRDERGLPPLSVDPALMRVARRAAPCFSHVVDGKWCWHRARRAGFPGWATDNIANGHPTPEDAVEGWATSHGHAMQMRGCFKMNGRWCNYKFNRLGVGVCGRKYIGVFGRDDSRPPAKRSQRSDG